MTQDQKIVGVGAASGVVAMIASMVGIYQLWPSSLGMVDINSRLAYALQANAFAVIPLLAAIMAVGNNRFLSQAIDPTLQKEDAATQINGRVVDNTLQQFVLFLVATTALSVNLTPAQMRIIPAAAIDIRNGSRCVLGWIPYPPALPSIWNGGDGLSQCWTSGICTLESDTRIMIDPLRRCPLRCRLLRVHL